MLSIEIKKQPGGNRNGWALVFQKSLIASLSRQKESGSCTKLAAGWWLWWGLSGACREEGAMATIGLPRAWLLQLWDAPDDVSLVPAVNWICGVVWESWAVPEGPHPAQCQGSVCLWVPAAHPPLAAAHPSATAGGAASALVAALLPALLAAAESVNFPCCLSLSHFSSFLKMNFTTGDNACGQPRALPVNRCAGEAASACWEQQDLHQRSRDWRQPAREKLVISFRVNSE